MEALLNEEITSQVIEAFTKLDQPVEVLFFGRQEDCEYCDQTLQLVEEVTALSDQIFLSRYDLEIDADLAEQFNVDKTPGLVIASRENGQLVDYGVRFAGVPAGHEFSSLIQDIILVSGRDSKLSQQTREMLADLKEPVSLQVFVTPTCPYCPQAVILAHQMAMESSLVQAEMVEATEFPDLSSKYRVSGVPQTTINEGAGHVVGAVPELQLFAEILRSINAN
ncbi:MAG TPA: thioredoxin family protein [Anaerolineales bacterium]|nr:thioredoxin family protein [Anaerolineales bacterium]